MQVGSISNGIADVDPDPKADGPIRRLVTVKQGNTLLHADWEPPGPVDTAKPHQQGVAAGLNSLAAIAVEGGINDFVTEIAQAFGSLQAGQPDQAAVTNHVGID